MSETYEEHEQAEIEQVLVGRQIVQAEMGRFQYLGSAESWRGPAEGRLVLDDGTTLYLTGNDGGCSCGAGDYDLSALATVDNIITSARVEALPGGDDGENYEGTYRIFVFADNREINVAEFTGSDGNGYYGTGFTLSVVRPGAAQTETFDG